VYTVEFYETADGKSELWDFLEDLREKSVKSKDARIQHKQISFAKNLKKHPSAKLKRQKSNALIIFPERSLTNHENME
jgi:hypothetical protein